jgi:hypothetical protein
LALVQSLPRILYHIRPFRVDFVQGNLNLLLDPDERIRSAMGKVLRLWICLRQSQVIERKVVSRHSALIFAG